MEKYKQYCLPLALVFSFVIAMQVLGPIWSNNNVFQDDFRQSLFWLWSLWDPELFKDDFFTPMYDSLLLRTPLLNLIYHLAPVITDNLIWYNKFLILVIFIFSAFAVFKFFEKISASVLLALSASITFSTVFWCTDHLSCGHTRSFLWFGLFYYMYLKLCNRERLAAIFTFVFLFLSPHVFIICFMAEFLDYISKNYKNLFNFKNSTLIGLIINFIAAVVLYKVIFKDVTNQGVGTAFTATEMKALPEFNPGGRHPIFGSDLMDGSWWTNEHWGLGIGYLAISKVIILAAIIIPIYLLLEHLVFKNKIDFKKICNSRLFILFASSIVLYFAAQVVFPALYLPSRFIGIPWLLVSVSLLILIFYDYLLRFTSYISSLVKEQNPKQKSVDYSWLAALLMVIIAVFFWLYMQGNRDTKDSKYFTRYVSITPEVRAILETTPKNSLIAGHPLLPDLNSASMAAKRKVFVDYERSMAYTKESLEEIRRRNFVALELTYAKSRGQFLDLARKNGITHYMALYDFYDSGYLANPFYIEPYNQRLRELVQIKPGETFFVQDFLKSKQLRYAIVDVERI